MQKKDRLLIILTALLAIILISKSLFLDEIKPNNIDELKFKQFVEKRISDGKDELGLLSKSGIASFRVVNINKISNEGFSKIVYFDEESKEYIESTISGQYEAKVRGYILSVIPYREFSVVASLYEN
jgi:hypothetical protein